MEYQYTYKAIVRKVTDGDTVRLDWDLGANVWLYNEPMRLYGINAPEIKGVQRKEGLKSKEALIEMLPTGKEVVIKTIKDKKGKYGRYLCEIYIEGMRISVNKYMIQKGFAIKF